MRSSARAALRPRQRALARSLAEALLPPGERLPGAGSATVERVERSLARRGGGALRGYQTLLEILEHATLLSSGARFSRLPRPEREAVLDAWLLGGRFRRSLLFALGLPLRSLHFDDPEIFHQMGCVYDLSSPAPPAAWTRQIQPAADLPDEEIECDVVVVGTGAGGAVAASELAGAGLAVVLLEEGEHRTRRDFSGRAEQCMEKLYQRAGATFSIGNAIIPIPMGRSVGGTTTINSGTCFRTPDRVLARWRDELGLCDFDPELMEPYFERVERDLGIGEPDPETLGGVARVVARGCETLGWSHHPLRRNAPDCDGQGVCVFGCPTDAKRSTNLSYVPMALERSALLVTGFRADRVRVEGGRAVGIEGAVLGTARRRRVRARAVVLACGAALTPVMLQRQGLLRGSRQLGRNLTIHPAVAASALFDEEIRAFQAIPQGTCVDEFHDQGILMEGGSLPLDGGATLFNLVGRELMAVMEAYDRVATFGAMVSESRGAGRVRALPGGRMLIQYRVEEEVRSRLQTAMVRICEIFFAAGALRVFPAVHGVREFRDLQELGAFARRRPRASQFALSAYHPLGTCRIGLDSATSVLDPDHCAHELPGLIICDGSALPGSPTVNPQVTIMAMAMRAAERLAARLEG